MKKIFLAAISIVCLMASCTKDEMQADPINPNEGKEVVFSSSIGEATRTLYAEENGNKIAVKWVDDDVISVYGASCSTGRQQADYKVKAATGTETTDGVSTNYYYAESLTKTGDVGVQWGSEATSDFYAVYPSVGDNQFTKVDGGVKVQTTVRAQQNVTFTKTTASDGTTVTWVGQHYNGAASNPTMTDAVMYAYTAGATSGEQVDLKFKPFSTVLRFTFKGFKAIQSSGEIDTEYNTSTVAVNKIVLTAPNTKIAGDFALTINEDGTASATEGTSNTIEIYPDYLPMKNNEQLQFDIFTIPTANVMPQDAAQAWKVQVVTEKGTFTFNMVPKTVTTPAEAPVAGLALTTGALHKLTIPLKTVTFDFDIPANNWIRYIPRNVYLSELSLPGAWYATNSDYQGSATLTDMYNAGVRAFNIDCRVTAPAGTYAKGQSFDTTDSGNYLAVAGTESTSEWLVAVNLSQGQLVKDAISTIAAEVSDEEFAMVVLTIAEKYKRHGTVSPAHLGSVDPTLVLSYIKSMLDENGKTWGVYGYRDIDAGKKLDANTTVKDVLGSIVVKVNVNADQDFTTNEDGTIATGLNFSKFGLSNALLCEGSMASDSDFISGDIVKGVFNKMVWAPMYWGSELISNPTMTYYYHQAQETTTDTESSSGTETPSLYDRMLAVDDIIDQSASIYSNGAHNALFQLGIGGYTMSGTNEVRTTVASTLNQHVLDKVNEKLASSPSPIGIVLMNFCTDATYKGPELVNAILEMNTKFYLNRDHDAEGGEWPDGNPFETSGDSSTDGGDDDGQQDEV